MPKPASLSSYDPQKVTAALNAILEMELAGVVRYTHYSLMVFGHARIPIVSWLHKEAEESLAHAQEAGELLTSLGGHPSLKIGQLLETHRHDIHDILQESLEHEREGLGQYHSLLDLVAGRSVLLEDYARKMIQREEMHLSEVEKMLRRPGELKPAAAG